MFRWLFGKKNKATNTNTQADIDEAESEAWYEAKSLFLCDLLGEEHTHVMHAIIPYVVGGGLDLYFYPNGIPGTGIATKELDDPHGEGPSNRLYNNYELVMFTRHAVDMENAKDDAAPFGRAMSNANAILNLIARYSSDATLNPFETCEFPEEMEDVGGKCLIFCDYEPKQPAVAIDLGLMLIIEIHRSEMEYARASGGRELIAQLKEAGHYPYSDLDRPPVV